MLRTILYGGSGFVLFWTTLYHFSLQVDNYYTSSSHSDLPIFLTTPEKDLPTITPKEAKGPHDQRIFVGIIVCTRSLKEWTSINETSLHTLLIPSLFNTITPQEWDTYRIELFVGFDLGDAFWSSSKRRQELQQYSRSTRRSMNIYDYNNENNEDSNNNSNNNNRTTLSTTLSTTVTTVDTILPINFMELRKRRPHQIPFNTICRAAYELGCDYLVRINDDTEFVTKRWISKGIQNLRKQFKPPNVGVVGPRCDEGNILIITHDMVHRTHLDIFGDEYYPNNLIIGGSMIG